MSLELNLQKEMKKLVERRKELFKLLEPIQSELSSNYKKIEKIKNEIGKLKIDKNPTDWNLLLDENSGYTVYNKYSEIVQQKGLYYGGYFPETGQRCIKVMLTKNSIESFNKTILALKEILEFIKPLHETYPGFKFIDIFEYTLSENGSYYMLFNEEEKIYKLMLDRYHVTHELKVFDSLEKIIKYVQENHWYKESE